MKPGAGDEGFEGLVATIKQYFDDEEYEQALPLCLKAAEARPDSPVARQCRVFALLQLSRWADALQLCDKSGNAKAFAFERAYCLYRLNKFQEALDALRDDQSDDTDRRSRLEAQVRYRMGDYEACSKMYEDLHKADPEEVGLLVNAAASQVSGDRSKEALNLLNQHEELFDSSYELCFNLACALIEEGKLTEAEARLEDAKDICIKELQEGEEIEPEDADAEDHEELASILVQKGCVLQRKGQGAEANDLYNRVLRQKPGQEVDITVLAVACNNVVALRSDGKNLFDSLKRINVASKESLEHKLTRKQTIEIAVNKCLLLIQARKFDEAKRELQRLRESHPDHPRVAIVQATILHAEKKPKACEEALQAFLLDHPGSEDVLLCLSQLFAQQGRTDKAIEALTQLPLHRRAQPQTMEAIATLHQKQKHPEKAIACIREAVEYWTVKVTDADVDTLASLLKTAARLSRQLKDGELTAEVQQLYLEKVDGSDIDALCGLVAALASGGAEDNAAALERAEEYARRLKVPAYDHLDAEALETAAIPKIGPKLGRKEDVKAEPEDGDKETTGKKEVVKAKRKRNRKIRYPKNFDPENPGPPPDPERWLPKRERTEYKKRMRKRDKQLARGPQGSMPTADDAFRKQGPSTAQVEVAKDSTSRRNQPKRPKGKK